MSTHPSPKPPDENWLPACYFENRRNFPPEKLIPYEGKHVAWSWDGTHIVDSADSYRDLEQKLKATGVDATRVVFSFVPSDDMPA